MRPLHTQPKRKGCWKDEHVTHAPGVIAIGRVCNRFRYERTAVQGFDPVACVRTDARNARNDAGLIGLVSTR